MIGLRRWQVLCGTFETMEPWRASFENVKVDLVTKRGNYQYLRLTFNDSTALFATPISLGALLHLLLDKKTVNAFIGDLQERYAEKVSSSGRTEANLWYTKESTRSIVPLAWAKLRRIAGLDALVELFRRIGS